MKDRALLQGSDGVLSTIGPFWPTSRFRVRRWEAELLDCFQSRAGDNVPSHWDARILGPYIPVTGTVDGLGIPAQNLYYISQ